MTDYERGRKDIAIEIKTMISEWLDDMAKLNYSDKSDITRYKLYGLHMDQILSNIFKKC